MMEWRCFAIEIDGLDSERLLSDWRWLVPDDLRPISLTIFGDWFLEDLQGCIWFLDVAGGQLSQVSTSRSSFLADREDPENFGAWYMADLASLCWERDLRPAFGQCLSFKVPPILSGSVEFDNIEVCDLMVHESIMGQIHRGVKDLPEGTTIDRFTVDEEVP